MFKVLNNLVKKFLGLLLASCVEAVHVKNTTRFSQCACDVPCHIHETPTFCHYQRIQHCIRTAVFSEMITTAFVYILATFVNGKRMKLLSLSISDYD